jgi:dephospho-CoA kinase
VTVPFVGLTGGLGAGKSTALEALATLGAAVVSSDVVVHELYETEHVREAVRARFGDDVFDGAAVDRGALARRVFAREEDRAWLEALLWPLVGERVEAFRAEASERSPAPLAGVAARYAATIAIVADDALRAERTAVRGQAELEQREARQLSQEEKARRARFVIVNDGSLAELSDQLRDVLARLSP